MGRKTNLQDCSEAATRFIWSDKEAKYIPKEREPKVIRKEADGYYVKSESGKSLGGPYKTKKEAEERLKQVEMFKHIKKEGPKK